MPITRSALLFVGILLVSPGVHADGVSDFAAAVGSATKDFHRELVIRKLTKFQVGETCMRSLATDKRALHMAMAVTTTIADHAKHVTGDDWSRIEGTSDSQENMQRVERLVDAFRDKFFLTIAIEGDDCGTEWLRYWNAVTDALERHPWPSGGIFVTIKVSSNASELGVDVAKNGTTFTIVAPKTSSVAQLGDAVDKSFETLASSPKPTAKSPRGEAKKPKPDVKVAAAEPKPAPKPGPKVEPKKDPAAPKPKKKNRFPDWGPQLTFARWREVPSLDTRQETYSYGALVHSGYSSRPNYGFWRCDRQPTCEGWPAGESHGWKHAGWYDTEYE